MLRIKESNNKFKLCDIKILQGEEEIEVNYNKSLMFEDDETKEEVIELVEEFAKNLKEIIRS